MADMRTWPEVIGIGSSVYDILMEVGAFPTEDTKLESIQTKVQGGGPCATALVAARKLGIFTAYMGTIGGDPFGLFMMEDFARWGVDTRYVRVVPGEVSFHSTVLLNRIAATRTCIWNRGTVPQPSEADIDTEALRHAKALHLDGHMLEAAMHAAKLCRQNGVKVSYDAGGAYPGVENLMPYTDWLIPSEEFALKTTGASTPEEAARKLYQAYHPELVVITQGVRGGIVLDGKGIRRYTSYKVDAKDTNGCGDTFHGAFVAAKIRNMDNDAACKYASAAAALKSTRLGARCGMATDGECRTFLKERNVML